MGDNVNYYHMCKVKHDPPNSYGDCMRACYATLLDVENIDDVPHFVHDNPTPEILDVREREYLNDVHGLAPFRSWLSGAENIATILQAMDYQNPGIRYMLVGGTSNGNHAVVCEGAKIIHNPAWFKNRIIGPAGNGYYGVTVFVPSLMVG